MWTALAATAGVALCATVGTASVGETSTTPAALTMSVVATYPHDPTSFTEGLLIDDGTVYESGGLYGSSRVQISDLATGRQLLRRDNSPTIFGEGLARIGEQLVQLSWREGQALFYDAVTLTPTHTATYDGEGWGLCHDGARLLMSNGSSIITVRDPKDMTATGMIEVRRDGEPVLNLNELECTADSIWANVWMTREILRIDAATGVVTGVIDATPLMTEAQWAELGADAVLNGIAVDDAGRMFVTGKLWPAIYEITVSDSTTSDSSATTSTLP